MAELLAEGPWADPGRIHHEAMWARQLLEDARDRIANSLRCPPRSVVLTSGATESIATAAAFGRQRAPMALAAPVEHAAVRAVCEPCDLAVDSRGRVDAADIANRLASAGPVGMVHTQWVNHELGTVQPIAEVTEVCRQAGTLLHVDAAQAVGHLPVDLTDGPDLLSFSAHKFGGPPGVGALVVRRGLRLEPLLRGGEQERARRAGMENLLGVMGMAAALEEATAHMDAEAAAQRAMADRIRRWAADRSDIAVISGDPSTDAVAPHIVCLTVEGAEPQALVLGLDQKGIAAHSGSACATEGLEPSPVLAAIGVPADRSLRLSFGWSSQPDDVDRVTTALDEVLTYLQTLRG